MKSGAGIETLPLSSVGGYGIGVLGGTGGGMPFSGENCSAL